MLALLKHHQRLAEANEILEILIAGAQLSSDQDALYRLRWEQHWILGHWGEPYTGSPIPNLPSGETTQLRFAF